jgi:succinate-semialdehyde dehydrogenase/glutarate-semialdehyde dehydrogenase
VGDGFDEGVTIGPLIDAGAAQDVKGFIDDAIAKGAIAITDASVTQGLADTFLAPVILTGATPDMRVFSDEIFGPVAPIFSFRDEKEAIELANDTDVGLACYFYTRDIGRIWRVAEGLEYGIVGINEGIISNPMAPFGGVKESGQGREGSKYGLDDYLEIKYMCMGGIDQ